MQAVSMMILFVEERVHQCLMARFWSASGLQQRLAPGAERSEKVLVGTTLVFSLSWSWRLI
eukprot:5629607-Amphidinium_carterae.1